MGGRSSNPQNLSSRRPRTAQGPPLMAAENHRAAHDACLSIVVTVVMLEQPLWSNSAPDGGSRSSPTDRSFQLQRQRQLLQKWITTALAYLKEADAISTTRAMFSTGSGLSTNQTGSGQDPPKPNPHAKIRSRKGKAASAGTEQALPLRFNNNWRLVSPEDAVVGDILFAPSTSQPHRRR